jgi:hypothetical protein
MSIRLRFLVTAVAAAAAYPAVAAPVPNPNAKYDPPTAVAQVASVQRVLDEIKAFATSLDPRAAEQFDAGIAAALGDKGFAGLDLKKPVAAYTYIKPKLEHTYGVFVLPITGEKEAREFLERLQVGVEEERGAKGVYRLTKRDLFTDEPAWRVRFHDGHAYLGVNADPDELAVPKLIPMRHLADAEEKDLLFAKLFLDRCPKEFKELADGVIAAGRPSVQRLEQQPPPDMPRAFPPLLKEMLDWSDRNLIAGFADGESLVYRMKADSNELTLTPKAGSKLLADVGAVKPAAGRFHQLITKEAVGGGWLTGAAVPKALREKAGPFFAEWIQMGGKVGGAEWQPWYEELAKAVDAAVTKGDVDVGLAVFGPNKDGHYSAVAAAAVADPAALQAAVKKVVGDLPKEVQGLVKFDAEKVGDVAVHVITIPDLPEPYSKVIGKKAEVRLAFGAGGVFVAAGPDGAEYLKRAVGLKPTEARTMDLRIDPAKVNRLIASVSDGGQGGMIFERLIGKEEGLRSLLALDVRGGKALTVTWTFLRLGGAWFGVGFGP